LTRIAKSRLFAVVRWRRYVEDLHIPRAVGDRWTAD
jgi:hypothetical protein